jgi:hypothetical protein
LLQNFLLSPCGNIFQCIALFSLLKKWNNLILFVLPVIVSWIYKNVLAGHGWLTPEIWEAEIGRMADPGQPGQKSLQDPISTQKTRAWQHLTDVPAMTGGMK